MKKVLLSIMATAMVATAPLYAGQLTREVPTGCGSGTSKAHICNSSVCTVPTYLSYGGSTSFLSGAVLYMTITFDYALFPGSVTTFNLGPADIAVIDAAGGSYVDFSIGGDYLRIRKSGRDSYSYYVFTIYC